MMDSDTHGTKVRLDDAERTMGVYRDGARALQAIAAEFGDYSERLLVDSTTTFQEVAKAASVPEAFNVLGAYTKRTTEEHVQSMARIAGMYAIAAEEQTRAFQALMFPAFGHRS